MEKRYFGTDGIRGRVGSVGMNAAFVVRLGAAIGRVLARRGGPVKVVIGKDTRISGYMLESALEAGLSAAGADVVLLGPLPTPAVAYLTRTQAASAGIVVSASHNPFEDNGIKLFSADGQKFDDQVELEIEAELDADFVTAEPAQLGKAVRLADAGGRYIEFVKSTLNGQSLNALRGVPVVFDGANGAGYKVGPAVLSELGLKVQSIGVTPNGININAECGATHLDALRHAVTSSTAALGIALDGDGDRLMLVSGSGRVVDGDDLLFLLALDGQSRGWLRGPVVGTLMTNFGIEQALNARGIAFQRARVGDRYVHEQLRAQGGILGGEASGHLLLLHLASTGDGLMSALQALALLARSGRTLDELVAPIQRYPQTMINVRVAAGSQPLKHPQVIAAQRAIEVQLGQRGRLVLRASGTEPLVRVTVEGDDADWINTLAGQLAAVVRDVASSD
jgi:phosphoglucosamine mutase